jgi:hypothetical protein
MSTQTTYRFIVPVEVSVTLAGEDEEHTYDTAVELVRETQNTWRSDHDNVTVGVGPDVPEPHETEESR